MGEVRRQVFCPRLITYVDGEEDVYAFPDYNDVTATVVACEVDSFEIDQGTLRWSIQLTLQQS